MKKVLFLLLGISLYSTVHGQLGYEVSRIPKPLLYKASAVIREDQTHLEVKSRNSVVLKKKTAVTILSKSGEDEGTIMIWYDRDIKVKLVKGVIYNEFGLPVRKFSKKDFTDYSAANDFSLYEDSRVKVLRPQMLNYPYTVKYEYELHRKQSLSYPDWYPVYSTGTSVERSVFTVSTPFNYPLRFKEINFEGEKSEGTVNNKKTVTWSVSNIGAKVSEPYSPNYKELLTVVKTAPTEFSHGGINGSFSNWEEYGKWVHDKLLEGRDKLSPSTVHTVKALVEHIGEPKEKARAIYQYMQQKTRYISVQIGVGGFRPYPAMEVDQLGYGDCKGLVNYTKALLKAVGIESYYSIVNAGDYKKDIIPDFASINDGNHIILCVPFQQDTAWLECTDKQAPFGFLGSFTDGRLVVLCTPEGGKLARTPQFSDSESKQLRQARFKINEEGDLQGDIKTVFEGTQYVNHQSLSGESFNEQVRKVAKWYPFPNIEIKDLDFQQNKAGNPSSVEIISLNSLKYAAVSKERMIIPLNLLNRPHAKIKEVRSRTTPVYINRGFMDVDEIVYEIPDNYKIDSYSKNIFVERPFGFYTSLVIVNGNSVTYKRELCFKEGLYQESLYNDLVDFYHRIEEGDNSKISLIKKQEILSVITVD